VDKRWMVKQIERIDGKLGMASDKIRAGCVKMPVSFICFAR
jgi:hypothetical protein